MNKKEKPLTLEKVEPTNLLVIKTVDLFDD